MVGGKAGVDYYFLDDFGGSFKATVMYFPYFLIATKVCSSREIALTTVKALTIFYR